MLGDAALTLALKVVSPILIGFVTPFVLDGIKRASTLVDGLTAYAKQWMGLGTEYQHKMLAGIVGFELAIHQLDCKLKINQHRPESHVKLHDMYAAGNENERALASWMVKLGLIE